MPIAMPHAARQRLVNQMRADLRQRREEGIPEDEHPIITFLWAELEFLAELAWGLLDFAEKTTEGFGDSFIHLFERYMAEHGNHVTLAERMVELYRAITAIDPVVIHDKKLRAVIEEARKK